MASLLHVVLGHPVALDDGYPANVMCSSMAK